MKKITFLFIALLATGSFWISAQTDLIIFSYNRPLQLYALLESVEKNVVGLSHSFVIYRADEPYKDAYNQVKKKFASVEFLAQGSQPKTDFKPLTLRALEASSSNYVVFAVDDIVVKASIDLNECVRLLEQSRAYGFYLRLGLNLTQCYPYNNRAQALPPLKKIDEQKKIYSW
mgnify:CR=1 FL=1